MRKSKAQERRLARKIGGRPTPGSGSTPFRKGDAQNSKRHITDRLWLAEAKTTGKDSIRIESKWLEKIEAEAAGSGRDFVLEIQFEATLARPKRRFYVLSEYLYDELIGQ